MYLLISTENNSHFSIAIGDKELEKIKTVNKPYKQSEFLLKEVGKIIEPENVNGIVVVEGPGQFSALRIGVVTANTLAFALKKPVVGVKLMKSWLELTEKEKLQKVWTKGVVKLKGIKFNLNNLVKPHYDKEPNITVGNK
jgi:tRNA A37 threonylcarbamoyladenosine modification protein TsaB